MKFRPNTLKHIYGRTVLYLSALVFTASAAAVAQEVRFLGKDELKAMLDDPQIAIFDVRIGRDWDAGDSKIKHAVHLPPELLENALGTLNKNKTIVLYCA